MFLPNIDIFPAIFSPRVYHCFCSSRNKELYTTGLHVSEVWQFVSLILIQNF
jgi:hypothetical protein